MKVLVINIQKNVDHLYVISLKEFLVKINTYINREITKRLIMNIKKEHNRMLRNSWLNNE